MKPFFSKYFLILGLGALFVGAFAGLLIAIVYLDPDFFKSILPFNRLRPLHTTLAVCWIILTATGGIYYYLTQIERIPLAMPRLGQWHFWLFGLTGIGILYSLLGGPMGGREYLAYFPILTIPILLGWILFGLNYFRTMFQTVKQWPVYYWMWGTGIVFMIYHLSEAHFWIFSGIREDFVKDITIQWKSYGSFVGSWNMLVYGTSIYLMAKIKGDTNTGRGKLSFFFYFLGLTNLMFGWAHHTYIIPTQPWIRVVAYAVSMTEWIILFYIIYTWAKSLSQAKKRDNRMAYRFLMASEFWVFLNIILALLMSIPALNYYSHGTHITVAHSMGTTIGINTTILLASVSFIAARLSNNTPPDRFNRFVFYAFNISLLVFWLVLITAGVYKAGWQLDHPGLSLSRFYNDAWSLFLVFVISGGALCLSLGFLAASLMKRLVVQGKVSSSTK